MNLFGKGLVLASAFSVSACGVGLRHNVNLGIPVINALSQRANDVSSGEIDIIGVFGRTGFGSFEAGVDIDNPRPLNIPRAEIRTSGRETIVDNEADFRRICTDNEGTVRTTSRGLSCTR